MQPIERPLRLSWALRVPWLSHLGATAVAIGCALSSLSCSQETSPGPTVQERKQAQVLDEPVDSLEFELELRGQILRLHLNKTPAPVSAKYKSFRLSKSGELSSVASRVPECIYDGTVSVGDAGLPIEGSYASVSTCLHGTEYEEGRAITGTVAVFGELWKIAPQSGDQNSSDGISHQVAKAHEWQEKRGEAKASTTQVRRVLTPGITYQAFKEGTPEETKYVEIFAVNDAARLASMGGEQAAFADGVALVAAANTIFANSGLSPRIRLILVGQLSFEDDPYPSPAIQADGGVEPDELIFAFHNWALYTELPAYDSRLLLSGIEFAGNTVGYAGVGAMCNIEYSGAIIQTVGIEGALLSEIVAHEYGHALGMSHDADGNSCDLNGFIMSPVAESGGLDNPDFSDCSQQYLTEFLDGGSLVSCINNRPDLGETESCGDGIVSGNEACDCGLADCSAFDPCCDGSTCQLTQGSECSDFNSTCCKECKIAQPDDNVVCRAAQSECDAEEVCNGKSLECPGDKFFESGIECTTDSSHAGHCFAGACASRAEECADVSERFGLELSWTDDTCLRVSSNCENIVCQSDANTCTTISGLPPTIQGATCGAGSQCQAGECVATAELDQCPDDPDKIAPLDCGCGEVDLDSDEDGTMDCEDFCPTDPAKVEPKECGCGETEADSAGKTSCSDTCPTDPDKEEEGICGCGIPDTDSDDDGTVDCNDNCPENADLVELLDGSCESPPNVGGGDSGIVATGSATMADPASGGAGAGDSPDSEPNPPSGTGAANGVVEKGKSKEDEKKGCGCHVPGAPIRGTVSGYFGFLVALAWLRRRREGVSRSESRMINSYE